jgi:hypothetical protein
MFKGDDEMFYNPKIQRLLTMRNGKAAMVLWLSGLAYCAKHLTDGALTGDAVDTVARLARVPQGFSGLLIDVGLWERNGTGFAVHDYLAHNKSRAEILAKRAADKTRFQRWCKRVGNTVEQQETTR